MTAPCYTPDTLGARWEVTGRTVRNMILRGELHGFRVGTQWRIPAAVVEAHEAGPPAPVEPAAPPAPVAASPPPRAAPDPVTRARLARMRRRA